MNARRWILPVFVLAVACASTPDRDERTGALAKPAFDDASFDHFDSFVAHQCGSLDCHGSRYRNMRVYGALGLRIPGNDCQLNTGATVPCTPGDTNADPSSDARELLGQTKPSEHMATYLSITGLEPEILDAVVRDHGTNPERLTFVRKAYGDENHKGYDLVARGSHGDKCMLSFFAGAIDTQECDAALPDTLACLSPSASCPP